VQSDDLRLLALLEMTAHGIADLLVKPREVIGLSKNRLSKGARCVSAFGRFFHHENQFGHGISSGRVASGILVNLLAAVLDRLLHGFQIPLIY